MSILLGLSSCDDFLTTTPNDAPTRNVFWTTEADVAAGTNGMYWLFRDVIMTGEGELFKPKYYPNLTFYCIEYQ